MVIKNLRKAVEVAFDLCDKYKCSIDGVELDLIPNSVYVTVGEWRVFLEDNGEASLWYKERPIASNIFDKKDISFYEDDEVYENGLYPSVFETLNTTLYDNTKNFSKDRKELEEIYNYEMNHRRRPA